MIKNLHMNIDKAAKSGVIEIVGIGPGSSKQLTEQAMEALQRADVIIGYKTYTDLIQPLVKEKQVISAGMRQEVTRCENAIALALEGKIAAVVCSGDPGIYGMAGLIFELLKSRYKDAVPDIEIRVIPGISALNGCAALLGAPLMHDFAAISLSDHLTPWEVIEKRLWAATQADFIIILYNPRSMGRPDYVEKAAKIIASYREPKTPVGIVQSAGRIREAVITTTLKDMTRHHIDMQSTVIIGNSSTFLWHQWMITPRGYASKYNF